MQLDRLVRDSRRVAKPALAGLLAALLVAVGLLAASGPLHRSLHHHRAAGVDFCAVCLLAQGQVEPPSLGAILIASVSFLRRGFLAMAAGVPRGIASLLPPGRAPPRPSSVS